VDCSFYLIQGNYAIFSQLSSFALHVFSCKFFEKGRKSELDRKKILLMTFEIAAIFSFNALLSHYDLHKNAIYANIVS
jgi:hypothetical protein